jgi:hypothetical protein
MKKLIVTAGMPRSGSTWLYNAVRLLLEGTGCLDIGAGWIADFNSFKNHDVVILKIHNFEPVIADNATVIFYSYRDVRDALASFKRKFGNEPSIDQAKTFIDNDNKWRQKASFIMKYEEMIAAREKTINAIARCLQIQNANPHHLMQEIDTMNYTKGDKKNNTYNLENLLHKNHITDGRHGSWKGHVPDTIITQIELECKDWLQANGYI